MNPAFANKSPQEVASMLLTDANRVQRVAEVRAWAFSEGYPNESHERRFFVEVVRCIVFGGEYPAVERRNVQASPAGVLAA